MPVAIILSLLLISNWILIKTFAFIPINIISWLLSLSHGCIFWIIVVFLAWCVGDD
ncbi:hypothetical protein NIES4102_05440 [Chondrocystis sp. NIES-4102]|nr:hypothetical protein NIES4102_05440 [Chondrocystis sp. NIES-4102]